MDDEGTCREDVKLPKDDEDLTTQIQELFGNDESVVVTVMSGMGQEKVVGCKTI
jgi:hypothetical protein